MPYKDKRDSIEWGKSYYKKNKERIRKIQFKYRLKNLDKEQKRHRKNNIRKYGITEEDYLLMFDKQRGVCKICKLPQLTKRLHIDHCHKKNKVRALLCENCNRGLGMFKEDIEILRKAIKYIKSYENS